MLSHKKYALAMLMILFRHLLFLMIHFRCLYNSLSSPGVDKLLNLVMKLMNSSSKNETQVNDYAFGISSKILMLIWWFWAILNDKWSACYKSSISRQRQLLYLTASIARSLYLLTQFISSQRPCLLLEISWILRSKYEYFVFLIVFLNCFQSSMLLVNLYSSRSLLQLMSHQLLKYFVMLTDFKFFTHILSIKSARLRTTFSSHSTLDRLLIFESFNQFLNKDTLLFATFDNCLLFSLNMFFDNGNHDC